MIQYEPTYKRLGGNRMDEFRAYQQLDKADKWKTLLEHELIILQYYKTGILDRDHAISVYQNFSAKNFDYRVCVQMETSIKQNSLDITMASNDQIIYNLNRQFLYLTGRSILEELRNGKQTGTDMVWQG